jgi:hypothetical protein
MVVVEPEGVDPEVRVGSRVEDGWQHTTVVARPRRWPPEISP